MVGRLRQTASCNTTWTEGVVVSDKHICLEALQQGTKALNQECLSPSGGSNLRTAEGEAGVMPTTKPITELQYFLQAAENIK
jgi:hypothetical protein